MTTSYRIILSDGTFDQFIDENVVVFDHGLKITGRSVVDYGLERNSNILHMVENFSSVDAGGGNPDSSVISNPLTGQTWYDLTAGELKGWDGTVWTTVVPDNFVLDGTYSVNDTTGEITLPRQFDGSVIIDNVASATNLNDHIVDLGAHDATAISFVPSGIVTAINIQEAVEQMEDFINDHVASPSNEHAASVITFNNSVSGLTAVDVQGAINEIEVDINTANTDLITANTNVTNHINDLTDAHDASAISFDDSGVSITATEVQEALDEIDTLVGTSGAGPLGTMRVRQLVANTSIDDTFEKVTFNSILFSSNVNGINMSGEYNTGSNRYVATFDQEVNCKFAFQMLLINNGAVCNITIRKNGGQIRSHRLINYADSANVTLNDEINIKVRLNAGDFLEAFVNHANSLTGGAAGSRDSDPDSVFTHFEFELVRDLS